MTLRVTHPFAIGELTSISSYRHFSTLNREEQDGTNRTYLYFDDANIERNTSWSQEFTLARKNTLADWVAGASYYYDDARQTSQLNFLTDSIESQGQNWTPSLIEEFKYRRGYDPTPWLATLTGVPVGSTSRTDRLHIPAHREQVFQHDVNAESSGT